MAYDFKKAGLTVTVSKPTNLAELKARIDKRAQPL